MDAQARQELLAAIQAFVGRHQAATDGTGLWREPEGGLWGGLSCQAARPLTPTPLLHATQQNWKTRISTNASTRPSRSVFGQNTCYRLD